MLLEISKRIKKLIETVNNPQPGRITQIRELAYELRDFLDTLPDDTQPPSLDKHKLEHTLDFIQGIVCPVSVTYKDIVQMSTLDPKSKHFYLVRHTVYVCVSHNKNLITIQVTKPGGAIDVLLTEIANKTSADYLEYCQLDDRKEF